MAAKRAADGNSVELNSKFNGDDEPDAGNKRLKRDLSNVSSWGIQEVCDFLNEKGLEDVVPTFIGEKITGEVLPNLTEDHLEKMGVESVGERLQVMNALKPFQKPEAPAPIFSDIHQNFKVFNDPIHGHIEMHPLCVRIMDTPQFQRLRNIKQLGGCYYVFPGASHHRFEHCIGVAWLAGQLVRVLRERQPELGITETDIVCVTIAGLCHDLGHGPYSHMFDGTFIPECRPGYEWKHEDASVAMFDYLVNDNKLMETFRDFGLNEDDLVFIKEQIRGPLDMTPKKDWKYLGRGKEKSFLYEVVANKRNGVDVDKWDYFARDCHHLGIKNNFDHQRFMKFARVLEVGGQLQICSRDKEVWNLYDMFYTRNMLHRRAYKHKTTKVVEDMITEAMIKANDHLLFEGKDGKMLRMSEAVDDMVAFCKITDHIYYQILLSNDPNLAPAKEILQKIERRQLYKCIGQTQPNRDKTVKDSEIPEIKKQIVTALSAEELGYPQLSTEDLIIHIIKMDYGMKKQNPIDFIRFYMKRDPTKPIQVRKDQMKNIQHEIQEVEKIIRLRGKIKDDTFFGRSLLPEMFMLTRKRNILEERYKILEEHENQRRLEEERLANVDFSVMKKSKAVKKPPESPDPKEVELQGLIKGCPQPNPGFMIRFRLSTAIKALKVQETTIDKVQVGRIVGQGEKRVPLTSSRARCYQTDKQLENIQKLLQNQRIDRCICKSPERQKKIRRGTVKDAWQEEASYVVSEMSHVAHDRSSEPCFNCVDNGTNRPNTVQGLSSIPHFQNMNKPSKKVSVSDSHQMSASAEESGQLVEEEDRPTCRYIYKHGQCSSTKNPHLLLRRPFSKAKDAPQAVGTIEILGGHDNSGFVSEDGFCPFCEFSPRGHVQRWLAAQQTGATKGIYGNPPRHKKKRRDLDAELDRRWTMLWAARGSTPYS